MGGRTRWLDIKAGAAKLKADRAARVVAGNILLNAEIELEGMIEQVLSASKRKR